MRSIGKVKIKKLKKLVADTIVEAKRIGPYDLDWMDVKNAVEAKIPAEWYDTWECAWSEIERLTDDFINDYKFGGGK